MKLNTNALRSFETSATFPVTQRNIQKDSAAHKKFVLSPTHTEALSVISLL